MGIYRQRLDELLKDRDNPILQFAKYGLFGGLATAADMLVFYLSAIWLFPALTSNDWLVRLFQLEVPVLGEGVQAQHFAWCAILSFIAGNAVAYVTNVLWVFDSASDKRHKEILLFTLFSLLSMIIATFAGWFLIRVFSVQTSVSFIVKVVVSLMVNFAARKYVIFRSGLVIGSQSG